MAGTPAKCWGLPPRSWAWYRPVKVPPERRRTTCVPEFRKLVSHDPSGPKRSASWGSGAKVTDSAALRHRRRVKRGKG